MKTMMRFAVAFLGLLLLAACQTQDASLDPEYRQAIVGTWSNPDTGGPGPSEYFEKTYNADGTASGFIAFRVNSADGLTIERERTTFESRWRIEGGVVYSYDVRYSDGRRIDEFADAIIRITQDVAEYEDLDSGRRFTRVRVKPPA